MERTPLTSLRRQTHREVGTQNHGPRRAATKRILPGRQVTDPTGGPNVHFSFAHRFAATLSHDSGILPCPFPSELQGHCPSAAGAFFFRSVKESRRACLHLPSAFLIFRSSHRDVSHYRLNRLAVRKLMNGIEFSFKTVVQSVAQGTSLRAERADTVTSKN